MEGLTLGRYAKVQGVHWQERRKGSLHMRERGYKIFSCEFFRICVKFEAVFITGNYKVINLQLQLQGTQKKS